MNMGRSSSSSSGSGGSQPNIGPTSPANDSNNKQYLARCKHNLISVDNIPLALAKHKRLNKHTPVLTGRNDMRVLCFHNIENKTGNSVIKTKVIGTQNDTSVRRHKSRKMGSKENDNVDVDNKLISTEENAIPGVANISTSESTNLTKCMATSASCQTIFVKPKDPDVPHLANDTNQSNGGDMKRSSSLKSIFTTSSKTKEEKITAKLNEALKCPRNVNRRDALNDPEKMPMPQETRERIEKEVAVRKSSITRKVSRVIRNIVEDDTEVDLV